MAGLLASVRPRPRERAGGPGLAQPSRSGGSG